MWRRRRRSWDLRDQCPWRRRSAGASRECQGALEEPKAGTIHVLLHVILVPGHHPTEEKYSIVEGEATMIFERSRQSLKKGDSVYLPPPVTARE